jgi:hypothetical protein
VIGATAITATVTDPKAFRGVILRRGLGFRSLSGTKASGQTSPSSNRTKRSYPLAFVALTVLLCNAAQTIGDRYLVVMTEGTGVPEQSAPRQAIRRKSLQASVDRGRLGAGSMLS